jgi:hemoglobin
LIADPILSASNRRAAARSRIEAETGIDEAMIERLVPAFYARVRADETLGPIFAARIADWEPHLRRMCAFWSSLALMSGAYHGQPMQKHLALPVEAAHFDRWLDLFAATAKDLCPPEAAVRFIQLAGRVAESLELGIAGAHGVMLAKGERFTIDKQGRDDERESEAGISI